MTTPFDDPESSRKLPADVLAYVAEVEARANGAKPERWVQDGTYIVDDDGNAIASTIWNDYSDEELAIVTRENNADFIAHARADVPTLIAIVREQAAERNDRVADLLELSNRLGDVQRDNMALRERLAITEQTKGELCALCNWAMKFPNEPCQCELEKENRALREQLAEVQKASVDVLRHSIEKGERLAKLEAAAKAVSAHWQKTDCECRDCIDFPRFNELVDQLAKLAP